MDDPVEKDTAGSRSGALTVLLHGRGHCGGAALAYNAAGLATNVAKRHESAQRSDGTTSECARGRPSRFVRAEGTVDALVFVGVMLRSESLDPRASLGRHDAVPGAVSVRVPGFESFFPRQPTELHVGHCLQGTQRVCSLQ